MCEPFHLGPLAFGDGGDCVRCGSIDEGNPTYTHLHTQSQTKLHPLFLFTYLGGRPHPNPRDAASQRGDALLALLFFVFRELHVGVVIWWLFVCG